MDHTRLTQLTESARAARVSLGAAIFFVATLLGSSLVHGHMLRPPRILESFHKTTVELRPANKGAVVDAVVVNQGPSPVWLETTKTCGWHVRVVDSNDRSVLLTKAGEDSLVLAKFSFSPGGYVPLQAGKSCSNKLPLGRLFAIRPGIFFVMARRLVGFGAKGSPSWAFVGTSALELDIAANGTVKWITKGVAWPKAPPQTGTSPPRLEFAVIPASGPVTALRQLAAAIRLGDAASARKLLYARSGRSYNLAVVNVQLAIHRLSQAAGQRFGPIAAERILGTNPFASVTQKTLSRLDTKSLRTRGDRAEIRVWAFQNRMHKWVPGQSVYFRRKDGKWLLADGPPRIRPETPKWFIERYLQTETGILDALRYQVVAGGFHSSAAFEREYNTRLNEAAKASLAKVVSVMKAEAVRRHTSPAPRKVVRP